VGGALDSAPVPAGDGLRSPVEGALAPPPAPNKDSFLQALVVDARAVKVLGGGPVGRPCCTGWPQRRSQRSAPSPAGWHLPTGASAPVVGAPGRRGEGGVAARVPGPGASEQSAPLVRSAPWDLATASLRILVTMPLTGLLQRVVATCTFTFLPPANEKIQGYYCRTRVMSSDFIKENIYFVGPLLVQSVYLALNESVRDDIFWLPLEVIGAFVPYYTVSTRTSTLTRSGPRLRPTSRSSPPSKRWARRRPRRFCASARTISPTRGGP